VSVITVTVLLSVIAHGASAEPLARRYGAAAGPGRNGDHGLPWAGLSTHLSFPADRRGDVLVPHHDQVAGAFALPQAGASLCSQAVARSRELGLLKGSGPVTSRMESIASAVSSGEQGWADQQPGELVGRLSRRPAREQAEAGGIVGRGPYSRSPGEAGYVPNWLICARTRAHAQARSAAQNRRYGVRMLLVEGAAHLRIVT
jgi:hypothetical protein